MLDFAPSLPRVSRVISGRGAAFLIALVALATSVPDGVAADARAGSFGTVQGVVSNAATSAYLDGAQVALSPGDLTVLTARDGRFVLPHVAAGEYRLTISYAGLDPKTITGVVAAGATTAHDIGLTAAIYQLDKFVVAGEREGGEKGRTVRIVIKTPNLNSVFAENFNEISLRDFDEGEMELTFLNGNSVRGLLDVNRLTLKQIGKNTVKLIGKNDDLNATLSDGATLDAAAFSSNRATVKANGKSTATVNADDFISKRLDETSGVKNVGKASGEENQE